MSVAGAELKIVETDRAAAWPATLAEALELGRQRDLRGHKLHIFFGMLYVASIALESAPSAIAFGLLVAMTIVRLPHTLPCYRFLARNLIFWLLLAWAGLHGASLLWSTDTAHGLHEVRAFRVVLTPLLLWPIIDRSKYLVIGFLIGVAVQNVMMVFELLEWFGLVPDKGRLGGLTHPNIAALMCVAAMCWHLAVVLLQRGRVQIVSSIGFAMAAAGLFASGGRALWLAAAVALPLMTLIVAVRRPHARRMAVVLAGVGVVGCVTVWFGASDFILNRYGSAMSDIERMEQGSYRTDIGHRVASWGIAWEAFQTAPVAGVGAGGFTVPKRHEDYGRLLDEYTHAHSLYMQVLACTGSIGALLVLTLLLLCLKNTWNESWSGMFADGTFFVLLIWLIGAVFNTYHDQGMCFGLFAFVATLALKPKLTANDITLMTKVG